VKGPLKASPPEPLATVEPARHVDELGGAFDGLHAADARRSMAAMEPRSPCQIGNACFCPWRGQHRSALGAARSDRACLSDRRCRPTCPCECARSKRLDAAFGCPASRERTSRASRLFFCHPRWLSFRGAHSASFGNRADGRFPTSGGFRPRTENADALQSRKSQRPGGRFSVGSATADVGGL